MIRFNVRIANQCIGIDTMHIKTYSMAREYLTPTKQCCFSVKTNQHEIELDRIEYQKSTGSLDAWDGAVEPFTVLRLVSEELVDFDTILVHGATIALGNKAIMFTGPSGIGKTTHIKKWLSGISGSTVVNGDKTFIKVNNDKYPIAYGSPWAGKEGMNSNIARPLTDIVLLERSERNEICKILPITAFPYLLSQTYISHNNERARRTIQLLRDLLTNVSVWHFKMNNYADDCLETAYDALRNS